MHHHKKCKACRSCTCNGRTLHERSVSRHLETNDDVFNNHESDRHERPFNPYTISRQPTVTNAQNSIYKMWHQVRGEMNNAEKL